MLMVVLSAPSVVPQISSAFSASFLSFSSYGRLLQSSSASQQSLPFPAIADMPSFHLPSPSPYSPRPPSARPPPPPASSHQSPEPEPSLEDSFLRVQPQESRPDSDLMARRRARRYARLPDQALLDSLPTSITPPSKPTVMLRPDLDSSLSHFELPCLNQLVIPPSPTRLPSLPVAKQLRASSSSLSASSASLGPDSLFDRRPPGPGPGPVPRPRRPAPGRGTTHSMMHLDHKSSSNHRPPEDYRFSHLATPSRAFDHRSSWHAPSSPGGTPELTTSPDLTPRPISTAYTTTTTSSSSSPPEPSSRRALAIAELVHTEATFARDMAVVRDIYLARARAEPDQGWLLPPTMSNRPRTSSVSRPSTATPTSKSSPSSSALGSVLNFGAKRRVAAFRKSTAVKTSPVSPPGQSTNVALTPSAPMSAIDTKIVFGNLEEVASLAETFAGLLLAEAGGGEGDRCDSLGACFFGMLPKIEGVFTAYCAKYESAHNRLQELKPSLTVYLEECQGLARGRTSAWDLPSLLIKPVQRCLKYPLLLDQILQLTPSGHPDRKHLEKAKLGMIAVADSINEAKRRYEYIEEIVGSNRSLPRRKPSRKTVPPPSSVVAKALARRSTRRSSADGVLSPMIDRLHESRRAVMELPAVLLTWAVRMREMNEQSGRVVEALRALYLLSPTQSAASGLHWLPPPRNGQPDVGRINTYQQHVATAAGIGPLKVMEARIRSEIFPLCEQLSGLYENPMAVIARRDAKEAELAHSPNSCKIRELIRAIDAQLIAELPRFHAASARFLDGIMTKVAKIQQDACFDLRTLLRHFTKSFGREQPYHQDVCFDRLEGLSILSLGSGKKAGRHHESYVLLESPPTLTIKGDMLGHEHIGIAMTTSSPVLPALY